MPEKTALLLIDIQEFYFAGGRWELEQPLPAAQNAARLLEQFRATGQLVVHVTHNSEPGSAIHSIVQPHSGEKIIRKDAVNAFKNTDLGAYLHQNGIQNLVIAGMMTHMCVEAATRTAADLGFKVTLVHDACATRALEFDGKTVPALQVHSAVLATLNGAYARVEDTEQYLKSV